MRGFNPTPSRMNTQRGDRGWLRRQQDALEREAARVRMIEEALANAPAEAEKRRQQDAELAERREANRRLRVSCPCCGVGPVPVLTAERVLAAFDRSRVDETKQLQARQDQDHRACPICDEARVDAEKAERIVAALAALPADHEPFPDYLQILYGIATAQAYHGVYALRVANGAIYPRRADAAPAAPPVPAADLPELPEQPRPARPYVVPPFLDGDV